MLTCEICGVEEAAFTVIPTGEGMPQSLGAACFARAGLNLAKEVLDPVEIAETLGPMFVPPARVKTLRKARSETPAHEPEPEPKTDERGDETDDESETEAKAEPA